MQADIDQKGPWFGCHDKRVREAFVAYMRDSAYPEFFKGIAQGLKPPRDRGFRIIKKHVFVDPKKRENTRAPCNLCGPKPKFQNDGMLIADQMGWLYLIGPICGVRHYEGRFRDEERRFDREQAERAAQDFLLEELSRIRAWRGEAERMSAHVEAAMEAHRRLAKTGKIVAELRRAIDKQGGWLQVADTRRALQANGDFETEHHWTNVTRIRGAAAVRTKCKTGERLAQATRVLAGFGPDEQSALEIVASAEGVGNLAELATDLRGAVAMVGEVRREIEEFQAFFSEQNFRAIDQWASDIRCPLRMNVECRASIRTLEADQARRRYPIDVSDLMRPLPTDS